MEITPASNKKEQTFTYVCTSCGKDVHLTKNDVVKCNACNGRTVYKVRNPNKTSIYLAR